ncbi:MAG: hypothetical protein MO846_02210 [Candidatus Devosia symbiotica]|nr:hypothetical protein [Candidatus Devosia symbiotica]
MLGLGWTEMLVIGVMVLIFIGPKDLPVVMSRVGKIIGQIKRMGTDFQRGINKTTGLDEVRNLRSSLTVPFKKTTDEIRKEFNAMTPTEVQPSGVIKPASPGAESVVDEIKAKAGMTEPTVPMAADETAKAASFKSAGPPLSTSSARFGKLPFVAAKKAPARAKATPTRPIVATDLATIDAPAPSVKKASIRKPAAKAPTVTKKPAAAKPVAAKAAAAPQKATAAKPAAKKRRPAKPKAASTAVAAADKARDQ